MAQFKCLGCPLDQTDDYWLTVWQNIKRSQKVWGRLIKMPRWERGYIKVPAMFYREEVQVVLLFRLDSWVLLDSMYKTVQGVHTGFFRQITGKWECHITGRMWVTPAVGGVREEMGTQLVATYIGRRQWAVAQCVALRLIFEVCASQKG